MPLGLHTAELNFETLSEIGQHGRNSEVYLAHDKQLDGQIVVKKIQKSRLANASEYYNEAKILYQSTHSNVVSVNYGCSDNDHIYIAMPFYKNGSLKQLIDSRFLSIREVLRYSIQFLSGLHNIHSKKLIHFDIKPDNILISDSNEALLSDFGLSKAMDVNGFADQSVVYPNQFPPEMFSSTQKTLHFDIYQAGVTIYRLLNGNQHFYSQFTYPSQPEYVRAVLSGHFPNRNSYLPHIPLKLQRIINTAISVDIADRYPSALEFINELSSVDENLDWFYTKNSNNETWEKSLPDKTFVINLDRSNGNNPIIVTLKTMRNSGKTTKVNSHCHSNLTNTNVLSSLKKAFREL